jgi:uncharacterized OB-fold protein
MAASIGGGDSKMSGSGGGGKTRSQLGDGDLCVGYQLPLSVTSSLSSLIHQSSALITLATNKLVSFGGSDAATAGQMHTIIPFDTPDITGVAWPDATEDDTDKQLDNITASPRGPQAAKAPTTPAKAAATTALRPRVWTCQACTMENKHTTFDSSTQCQTCGAAISSDVLASILTERLSALMPAEEKGPRIQKGRLPGPLIGVAAVQWNNDVYICGGIDSARQVCSWRVWRYNVKASTWSMVYPNPVGITPAIASSSTPPSSAAPCRGFMQATVLADAIYCFGGVTANGDVVRDPTVHRFCLRSHQWTIVVATPSTTSIAVPSVVVATAAATEVSPSMPIASSLTLTRSFSAGPGPLPVSVWGGVLVSQEQSLWLFGGSHDRNGAQGSIDQWWELRLNDNNNVIGESGIWVPHNQLRGRPSPRFFAAAACSNNCLYIHGGHAIDSSDTKSNSEVLADIHRFDFFAEQWSRVILVKGQPIAERWGHSMGMFRNRLYIMGGKDKTGTIVPGVHVLAIRKQMLPYKRDDVTERDKEWSNIDDSNQVNATSMASRSISGGIWTRLLMGVTSRNGNVQASSAPASTAAAGLLKYNAHGSMITVGDRMYLCGGQAPNGCTSLVSFTCPPSNVINDNKVTNTNRIPFPINAAVTSLRPHAPLPFPLYGIGIVEYHGALYVWGGRHGVTQQCSDLLLKYDIKLDEWAVLRTRGHFPPALSHSSVTIVHDLDAMLVFGGQDHAGRVTSRVWLYSFHQQRWWAVPTSGQVPNGGRHSALMTVGPRSSDGGYDSATSIGSRSNNKRSIWIHGGEGPSGPINTTHELRLEFDAGASSRDSLPPPPTLARQVSTTAQLLALRAGLPFFATHTKLRDGLQVVLSGDWEGKHETDSKSPSSLSSSSSFEWPDLSDGKNHATQSERVAPPTFTSVRFKDYHNPVASVVVKRPARASSPPAARSSMSMIESKDDEKRLPVANATPIVLPVGIAPIVSSTPAAALSSSSSIVPNNMSDDVDDSEERRSEVWKTARVVRFTGDTGLAFPDTLILPMPYTVIIVDRYHEDAKQRGRTLQSRDTNWCVGRYGGMLGHHAGNGWVPGVDHDPTIQSIPGMFNISTATMDHNGIANWYIDGIHRGTAKGRHPPGTLAFGRAGWKHDGSDADVAAVLVWNRVLDAQDRAIVELGLAEKYGIHIAHGIDAYQLSSFTPARSKRQSSVIVTERALDGSLVTTVTTTTREPADGMDGQARPWRVRAQWAQHECEGSIPTSRSLAAGVGWHDSMAIWGGQAADNTVNDGNLYVFSYGSKTWRSLTLSGSTTPVPRRGHSICYDHNGRLFIYGGQDQSSRYQQELYVCDLHSHIDDDMGVCMEYNEVQHGSKLYVLVAKVESKERLKVWICNHGDRACAIKLHWTLLQSCELIESCPDEMVLPPGTCELYAVIKLPSKRQGGWRYSYDASCHWDQSRLPCHSWFRLSPTVKTQTSLTSAHTTFPIEGGFLAGRRKVLLHGIILAGERFVLELKRDSGTYTYLKMESRPDTQQIAFSSASPAWLDEVLVPPYASTRQTSLNESKAVPPAKNSRATPAKAAAAKTPAKRPSGEVKESKGEDNKEVAFPFVAGQQFWLEITANDVQFTFTVRTGSGSGSGIVWSASYMHRLPYPGINQLTLAGDVYVINLDKVDATYVCPRGDDCTTCTVNERVARRSPISASDPYRPTSSLPPPSIIRTSSVVHRGLATTGKFIAPKVEKPSSLFESLRGSLEYERSTIDSSLHACLEEGRLDTYLPIIEKCLTRAEKFCDPFFPPNAKSLGEGTPASKVTSWKRPSEYNGGLKPLMISSRTDPCDVIQGELGDCYFLSSLSLVASRPHVFASLIIPTGLAHIGLYAVRFYKNGSWRTVVVDDRIPCGHTGMPIFGKNNNEQEIWVPIIEKAYAKLHGSYMAIDGMYGGKAEDALVDLTGGIPEHFSFHDHGSDISSGRLYNKLLEYHLSGHLLCGAMVPSISANELRGQRVDALGIEDTHAYSILSVRVVQGTPLIQLRNPYGHVSGKWKGAWSDWCELWNPSLLSDTGYRKGQSNGIFWMSYFDFVARFNVLHVVRTGLGHSSGSDAVATLARPMLVRRVSLRRHTDVSENWESFSYRGQWSLQKRNAGGSAKFGRWRENVQYTITVDQPSTKVIIVLTQDDVRMNSNVGASSSNIHRQFNDIGFVLMRTKYADRRFVRPVNKVSKYLQYQSTFSGSRAVSAQLKLPYGIYALIPSTYTPLANGHLNYVLDVYVMSRSSATSVTPVHVPLGSTGTGGGGSLPGMPHSSSMSSSAIGAGPSLSSTSVTATAASTISTALPSHKPQFYRETSKGVISTVDAKSAIVRRVVPVNDWKSAYAIAERPKEKIIWIKRRTDGSAGGCSVTSTTGRRYECFTCDQKTGKVVCLACYKRCHDGHIMVESSSNKPCDCGTNKISGFHCVCVRPRSHWRCLNPSCGEINVPGRTACAECDQTAKEEVEEQVSEKKNVVLFRNVYRLTLTPRQQPASDAEAAADFSAATAAQVQAIAASAIAAGLEVPAAVLPALTRQSSDNAKTAAVTAFATTAVVPPLDGEAKEEKTPVGAAPTITIAPEWICTFCQYTNTGADLMCDFCGRPKPAPVTTVITPSNVTPAAASSTSAIAITLTPPSPAPTSKDEDLPTSQLLMVSTASGMHNTRPLTGSPSTMSKKAIPVAIASPLQPRTAKTTPHAFVVVQAVQATQSQLSTQAPEDPHLALSVFIDRGAGCELKLTETDRVGYTGFNRTQEIFLTLPPKGKGSSAVASPNGSVSYILVPWIKGHGFSITTFSDCDCKLTKLNISTSTDMVSPNGSAIDADIERYGLRTNDGKMVVPNTVSSSGSVGFGPSGPTLPIVIPSKVETKLPVTPTRPLPPAKKKQPPQAKPGDTGNSSAHALHALTLAVGLRNRNCDCCPKNPIAIAWQCKECGWDECPECFDRNNMDKKEEESEHEPASIVVPSTPIAPSTPTPVSPSTPNVPSTPMTPATPASRASLVIPVEVPLPPSPMPAPISPSTPAPPVEPVVPPVAPVSPVAVVIAEPVVPVPVPVPAPEPTLWNCVVCTFANELDAACGMCGTVRASTPGNNDAPSIVRQPSSTPVTRPAPPNQWTCELCTTLNPLRVAMCATCGTRRPQQTAVIGPSPKKAPSKTTPLSPLSTVAAAAAAAALAAPWSCGRCTVVNAFTSKKCSVCDTVPTTVPPVPIRQPTNPASASPAKAAYAAIVGSLSGKSDADIVKDALVTNAMVTASIAAAEAKAVPLQSTSIPTPVTVVAIPTSIASTPTPVVAVVTPSPSDVASAAALGDARSAALGNADNIIEPTPTSSTPVVAPVTAGVSTTSASADTVVASSSSSAPPIVRQSTLDREVEVMASLARHMATSLTSSNDSKESGSAAFDPASSSAASIIAAMTAAYTSTSSNASTDPSSSTTSLPISSSSQQSVASSVSVGAVVSSLVDASVSSSIVATSSTSVASTPSLVPTSASITPAVSSSIVTPSGVAWLKSLLPSPPTTSTPIVASVPRALSSAPAPTDTVAPTTWSCAKCTYVNGIMEGSCAVCAHHLTPPAANTAAFKHVTFQDWDCTVCTVKNAGSRDTCSVCGATIPDNLRAAPVTAPITTDNASDSYWKCLSCELVYPMHITRPPCHYGTPDDASVVILAKNIQHSSHPAHQLYFRPQTNGARCDVCAKTNLPYSYRCDQCNWDTCFTCYQSGTAAPLTTWTCTVCEGVNQIADNPVACAMCTSLRPLFARGPSLLPPVAVTNIGATPTAPVIKKQWTCSACATLNESDWEYCTLCGTQNVYTSATSSSMTVPSSLSNETKGDVKVTPTPSTGATATVVPVVPTDVPSVSRAVSEITPPAGLPALLTSSSILLGNATTPTPVPTTGSLSSSSNASSANVAAPTPQTSQPLTASGATSSTPSASVASSSNPSVAAFDAKTVCDVWEKAITSGDKLLASSARAYIGRRMEQVCNTDSFTNLSRASIKEMITWPELECSEAVLFSAVNEWAESDLARRNGKWPTTSEKRDSMMDILPLLHLPSLSVAELTSIVQPSGLLEADVLIQLLEYAGGHDEKKRSASASRLPFPALPRGTVLVLSSLFNNGDAATSDDLTRLYGDQWSFIDAPSSVVTNARLCATPPVLASSPDKLQTIQLPYTRDVHVGSSSDWKHLVIEWQMGGDTEPLMAGLQLSTSTISFNTNGHVTVDGYEHVHSE